MPPRLLQLCALLLLSLLGTNSQAEEVLVFGDENYRPVIYLDQQQQPAGLLIDVLARYTKVSGTPVKIRLYPWKRAYTAAENAQGGVIGLSKTAERLVLFDYSEPIYDDTINVVVRKGHEFPFSSLEDLRSKKIGVQLGASYGSTVDEAIQAGALQVEADQSHVARLRKLLHGRLDAAFLGNGQLGLDTILGSDAELARHRDEFVILEQPLTHDLLYLGFAKSMGMQDFLADFNRILAQEHAEKGITGLSESSLQP